METGVQCWPHWTWDKRRGPQSPPPPPQLPPTPQGLHLTSPSHWDFSTSTVPFASPENCLARPQRHPSSCHYLFPRYGKHCSHLLVGSHYFPGSHHASRAFALEGSRHGYLGSRSQQQTCPLLAASLTVRGPKINSEFGVWEKQGSGVTPFVTLTTAPLYGPCDPVLPGG